MRIFPVWTITVLSVLLVTAAWIGVTAGGLVRDLFLPGPLDVGSGLMELIDDGYKGRPLLIHVGMSLYRVVAGFVTGALVGTLLGMGMGYVPRLNALAAPFIEFLRPLPQLAYLILLIIWLGIGETSKITMLFLAALPVSTIAARNGVANVPPERIRVAQALGAGNWQIFRHVIFPSALPEILVGARLAAGIVYGTLIASEIKRHRLDGYGCRPVLALGLRVRRHRHDRAGRHRDRSGVAADRAARGALGWPVNHQQSVED
jgi:taurine transport system permease protein